jgi:hypothetical protein
MCFGWIQKKMHKSFSFGWIVVVCLLMLVSDCLPVRADFNTSAWKHYRNVRISPEYSEKVAAIALEAGVLEKCRPDSGDLRIIASDGELVPFTLLEYPTDEELTPFPVRVYRVAKSADGSTDIWVDKSAKTLTNGILVRTNSRDFIRKVEIRGSDTLKEGYIVRMDGLLLETSQPIAMSSLKIRHPVNNFQYLQIRILEDEKQPLKIEMVECFPPSPANPVPRSIPYRLIEKRTDPVTKSITMVTDLGERRLPLGKVKIATVSGNFTAKLVLSGTDRLSGPWRQFYDGTVFRIRKDDAHAEELSATMKPQYSRFVKAEFTPVGASLPLETIEFTAAPRLAVFEYHRDMSYRLFYDNPNAVSVIQPERFVSMSLNHLAAASSGASLEDEQKNIQIPAIPKAPANPEPTKTWGIERILGIIMLLAGLLLLFILMLRARSLRKARRGNNARIVYTRYE